MLPLPCSICTPRGLDRGRRVRQGGGGGGGGGARRGPLCRRPAWRWCAARGPPKRRPPPRPAPAAAASTRCGATRTSPVQVPRYLGCSRVSVVGHCGSLSRTASPRRLRRTSLPGGLTSDPRDRGRSRPSHSVHRPAGSTAEEAREDNQRAELELSSMGGSGQWKHDEGHCTNERSVFPTQTSHRCGVVGNEDKDGGALPSDVASYGRRCRAGSGGGLQGHCRLFRRRTNCAGCSYLLDGHAAVIEALCAERSVAVCPMAQSAWAAECARRAPAVGASLQ